MRRTATATLPRVLSRAGEREADDGAERPQEGEVLAGLEPTRACDRGQERAERLAAMGAVAADQQVGAAHGFAAARAGGKLLPRPLGQRPVAAGAQLLPRPRRLQAQLGLAQAPAVSTTRSVRAPAPAPARPPSAPPRSPTVPARAARPARP